MRLSKAGILFSINVVFVSCVGYNYVSEHSLEYLKSLNLSRQRAIQEACRQFPPKYSLDQLPRKLLRNILIDHRHKLLYCYVPKVACTNWKRIMMILSHKWKHTDPVSIPSEVPHRPGMFLKLGDYRKNNRDYMLGSYHKMIVVRNPFERILSAYRNKLVGNSASARQFQLRVGRHIIQTFRPNPLNHSLIFGNDATFKEFATFLTSSPRRLTGLVKNEHWRPITDLCHPCLINYTLVGKYETIMDDARLTLHTINASHIRFPQPTHRLLTAKLLPSYFSQLDKQHIQKLYDSYIQDFRIFNYTTDNIWRTWPRF